VKVPQRIQRLGARFVAWADAVTRPDPQVPRNEQQLQARLTAASLLIWLGAFGAEFLWWLASGRSFPLTHLLYVLPLLVGMYILSRTRYFMWAALSSVVGLTVLPHLLFYANWAQPHTAITMLVTPARYIILSQLIWLLFPLLLAAMLLSPWMSLVSILLIIHSVWWIPGVLGVPPREVALLYGLLWGIGGPIWIMALIQKRHWRRLLNLQDALTEQRDFLQTVIDSVDAPFYVIDAQTYEIVLANQRTRALGPESARLCYALTHRRETPCDGLEHPCPLEHVIAQREPFTVEHVHYTPDGEPYFVEVHGYPILDEKGDVRFMIEYSLDITERKKSEMELRKLWRAIEHSAHGIVITDAEGVIEYVNPAFTRVTGYTPEEAIGRTPRILRSGYHDDAFYADLWQTIKSGRVWHGEFVNRRKDGSLYYEEQTIAPVPDEQGRITHFIAVKQDITQRKHLIRELKEAKTQTEQALAFKSALLATISHDLRTPLGAIVGYADMLQQGVFGAVNEEQKERLEAILSSAYYMRELISMLLLHAEMESNSLQMKPRVVSLPKLLATVRSSLWVLAQKRGLGLDVALEPDAPLTVYLDPRLLRSVLTNLVSNALKFTKEGGVTVRVYRRDDEHWAISVSDTGVGMSAEEQQRIFDPFYTRSHVKMSGAPGLGLGLYIVRSLVERLNGEIEVWSAEGQGSVFTVVFADADTAPPPSAAVAQEETRPLTEEVPEP